MMVFDTRPLSKKKATYIRQLSLKKYRLQENAFVLEGEKNIQTLLTSSYAIRWIVGTAAFFMKQQVLFEGLSYPIACFEADTALLSTLGSLQHNHDVLAVVDIPKKITEPILSGITLALDNIRDPGNLGTMMRIADWYGITNILCSNTTVELYNPKVLQASMGSFLHVQVHYVDLYPYLQQLQIPIIGATLQGSNVHHFCFPNQGILVVGNESHGIDYEIEKLCADTVTIPAYGHVESLNAAMATAIICDNWRRSLQPLFPPPMRP